MPFDPGDLRERVRFDPRGDETEDELGNKQRDFDPGQGVARWAKFLMRPGSETMTEARLAGRQPLTAVVRSDSATRAVTPDWRMVDLRTGTVYAIQAAGDMERDRAWISLVCEAGTQP